MLGVNMNRVQRTEIRPRRPISRALIAAVLGLAMAMAMATPTVLAHHEVPDVPPPVESALAANWDTRHGPGACDHGNALGLEPPTTNHHEIDVPFPVEGALAANWDTRHGPDPCLPR